MDFVRFFLPSSFIFRFIGITGLIRGKGGRKKERRKSIDHKGMWWLKVGEVD